MFHADAVQAGVCIAADDRALINSKTEARGKAVELKTLFDRSEHTCTMIWSISVFITVSQ
jgi:hypothetical protein